MEMGQASPKKICRSVSLLFLYLTLSVLSNKCRIYLCAGRVPSEKLGLMLRKWLERMPMHLGIKGN
jgi:hypothetical protein